MKLFRTFLIVALASAPLSGFSAEQLRVFIRAGAKTHGPGAHDYPKFLQDWTKLLNERGAKATGGLEFPTREQLEQTDVLVLNADRAGNIRIGEERKNLEAFLKRGGGLVVLHAGAVADDSEYYKKLIGGSWKNGTTKWLEGPMALYFTDRENPITAKASNFDLDDEIYYDMDVQDDVHVLASAYTPKPAGRDKRAQERAEALTGGGKKISVYDTQPQMWTYERQLDGGENYRAFVSIPGHFNKNFDLPNYRAILLRGIAWAGQLKNIDQLASKEELADLRYPASGPTHPSKALSKLEVHPEFNAKLVASEPLVNKVLNLDWDEKGRMWVCETPEYPNGLRQLNVADWKDTGSLKLGKTDREPQDRISILTDTDGDGVMDKKQVFADKLELVTSFVLHKKGVIAATAPDVWFLEDTDGDEIADKRTKLYTGLGSHDSHAVINNLRWGYDGWIYATVGYSAGHPTSPDGSKDFGAITAGVVRFKADGSAFEQFSSKNSNTWGLNITSKNEAFFTQPTCGDVLMHVVLPENILSKGKLPGSNSYNVMIKGEKTFPLMKWEQQAYVQIDQVGAYTAASGCAIYEGGTWPERWNYSYFTGEPTINILSHRFVTPQGVTYRSEREQGREETEFIRSTDLWFRPVENRVGPDGALYVVDFYNQAVIHNDTRGPVHGPANAAVRPDRDHYFARVWRVDHKEAKKLNDEPLDRNNLKQLWQVFQKTPNAHRKANAWRLLNEGLEGRESDHADLAKLVQNQKAQFSVTSKPMELFAQASKVEDGNGRANLLSRYVKSQDDWTKSSIIAAASSDPFAYLQRSLTHPQAEQLGPFVSALLSNHVNKSPELIRALVVQLGNSSKGNAVLINEILTAIYVQAQELPELDDSVTKALHALLGKPAHSGATLPLAAKWDKNGKLKAVIDAQVTKSMALLSDVKQNDAQRLSAARSLLGARHLNPAIVPAVSQVIASEKDSIELKRSLLVELGNLAGPRIFDALIQAYPQINAELQNVAFDQIVKRPESTQRFLQALEQDQIKVASVGPTNLARLRTYPAKTVAVYANRLLDRLSNPTVKEKEALIAKLAEAVKTPGNAQNGKVIYAAACAICHVLGDEGKTVGPILTGMGAHGAVDLLGHIVDPNREVDPSFWAINITRKNGETLVGVVAQENSSIVVLRNQGGEFEIRKDDIAKRENTRRSLMPEGFEGLGADNLRDLLTYMTQAETRFRIVDLKKSYTSDSRNGLFRTVENKRESLVFNKYGNIVVEGIPFYLVDPENTLNGTNVVVLKGGNHDDAHSKTLPQRVEIPVGLQAKSIHLLGNVGGWGFPAVSQEPVVALRVTTKFVDGKTETYELKNGMHFADYFKQVEVPGSKHVPGLVESGQVRYLSLPVKHQAKIQSLVLESMDNHLAPLIAAITLDDREESVLPFKAAYPLPVIDKKPTAPKKPNPALMPAPESITWDHSKPKALIVAGGTSHDFRAWFEIKDKEILENAGFSVNFTENAAQAAVEIKHADVVIVSVNRPFFDTLAWRKALFDHADQGKGIIMLHPGTWYGYAKWPALNAQIVGGGSRGHDKLGEFSVNVTAKDHPVMAGVSPSFKVVDELYYMNAEGTPEGTVAIEVLAETSPSEKYGRPHPNVWVAKHPKARVIGMALGHDERVHEHPDFQKLLINAAKWSLGK